MQHEVLMPADEPTQLLPEPAIHHPPATSKLNWVAGLAALLILGLGAYFRFVGLSWDDSYHLHPDERFLTQVANALALPDNPIQYLQTSVSPLNPYGVTDSAGNMIFPLYVYGNFPMTVTRLVAELAETFCRQGYQECAYNYVAYDGVHLVGRFLSGFVDLISVALIYAIGKRLYNARVGLLAAFLTATAVMPIQQSHFFTMDNWAAMFSTLTVYYAVRASEQGERWRWWALFGVALGLASASRINVALIAGIAPVAAFIWLMKRNEAAGNQGSAYFGTPAGSTDLRRAVLGVIFAAVASMFVFRLAQPYAFMDRELARAATIAETGQEPNPLRALIQGVAGLHPQFLSNMAEIQRLQSPEASFPPALQWTARSPILFPISNMILYGMGITAGVAAWGGFCWALWQIIRGRSDWLAHLLPLAWGGGYFLFMGTRWVKSIRYFLPIYPVLLLLGAWGVWRLWERSRGNAGKRILAGVVIGLTTIPTLLWANAFVQIYQKPVTRIAASEWMLDHIPSGATLLYQLNGGSRELQLPLKGYNMEAGSFPLQLRFSLPEGGTVTGVRFNYLSDPDGRADSEKLMAFLVSAANPANILAEESIGLDLDGSRRAVEVDLPPTPLLSGTEYLIVAQNDGTAPILMGSSVISNEHWDDPLPVRYAGKDPFSQYFAGISGGQMTITHPDDAAKIQDLIGWIDEADVIVLSSQRSLWNTPRLPLTYPGNIAYYDALFSGELGFELAAQFHADFHIGPLYISDTTGQWGWGAPPEAGWPPPNELAAEEAFSVYDHPPVWIFVKSDDYSLSKSQQILGGVDLSQQMFMNPGQATQAPNGLLLSDEAAAAHRANGDFNKIFHLDGLLSNRPAVAAVVWWLAVIVLGWLTFPLAFLIFPGLADRGYMLSRILALLLISYFGWLLASLEWLPNSRGTLLLGMGLLAAANAGILLVNRSQIAAFLRANRSPILYMEAAALFLYILFILVRLGNPDVWDVIWGGEKPMDMAYFNATLKSVTFPPYDPWFSDGYINYYYYGFVYVGSLTKLLGIMPAVAYNLILPMLYSFTGMGAFSLAYNLVAWRKSREGGLPQEIVSKALTAGFAGMAFCVLLGNLAQVGVMVDAWERSGDTQISVGIEWIDRQIRRVDGAIDSLPADKRLNIGTGDWFWNATRTVNFNDGEAQPITEFPYFTFLYGDLHAHMISMPLMLLALGWTISVALQAPTEERSPWSQAAKWLVGGLAIGALRATNTWDLPTYLVIGSLGVCFAAYRRYGRFSVQMAGEGAALSALLAGIALLTFLPFAQNYGVGYSSAALWGGSYTYVMNYLTIYGLFLFVLVAFMAIEFRRWSAGWTTAQLEGLAPAGMWLAVGAVVYLLALVVMLWRNYWIAPLAITLALFAGILALRSSLSPPKRIALALTACALGLTLAVEVIVLEGDIGRMNTVFKFYMQVWLILSVTAGAALAWTLPTLQKRRNWLGTGWKIAFAILVGMALLYPITATAAKWSVRMTDQTPLTLDGMAFMETTSYADSGQTISLHYDYDAIKWMQANIPGSPVIAEAHSGNPYRSVGNRVANYTGLPAIVGWDWHQRQQRAVTAPSMVTNRIADVNALFGTPDIDQALIILKKYDVEYIYAGQLEWVYYPPAGMNKFAEMAEAGLLDEVYRNDGVSIYRVNS